MSTNLFNSLFYFCLHLIFVAVRGLVAENRAAVQLWYVDLPFAVATLVLSTGCKRPVSVVTAHGLSSCSSQALEHGLTIVTAPEA